MAVPNKASVSLRGVIRVSAMLRSGSKLVARLFFAWFSVPLKQADASGTSGQYKSWYVPKENESSAEWLFLLSDVP